MPWKSIISTYGKDVHNITNITSITTSTHHTYAPPSSEFIFNIGNLISFKRPWFSINLKEFHMLRRIYTWGVCRRVTSRNLFLGFNCSFTFSNFLKGNLCGGISFKWWLNEVWDKKTSIPRDPTDFLYNKRDVVVLAIC